MISLRNPIPETISDPNQLKEFFSKYNIIPYYGDNEYTSHSMLQLLSDITSLSPSHNSCKRDICTYAFSDKVSLAYPNSLFISDDIPVSDSDRSAFVSFLTTYGLSIPEIVEITRQAYHHIADVGNAYIRIRIEGVNNTRKVFFKILHYKHCAYLRTKDPNKRVLIYTKKWGDESYWARYKPKLYPVSYINEEFNWVKTKNGLETVLHLRNMRDESDFYGRPDILSVFYWLFVEWAQQDLNVKIASTEFVSKLLLAFEEPDPVRLKKDKESREEQFRKKMAVLRQLTTNEGETESTKTLVGLEYPHGGKPPTPIRLEINRDTWFNQFQIEKAAAFIYAQHGWDKQLTGFQPVRSNIGGNVIIDLFTVKNTGTILPLQNKWSQTWHDIFKNVAKNVGYTGPVLTIKFMNLIDELVNKLIISRRGTIQVTSDDLAAESIQKQEEVLDKQDQIMRILNENIANNHGNY